MIEVLGDTPTLVKYVFRVLHIGGIIAIAHKTISDYFSDSIDASHAIFYSITGLVMMAAGFVNTYLLDPKQMGEQRKLWVGFHHLKLLISLILFTPIARLILTTDKSLSSVRMVWLISLIFISPFMRFYREYYVKRNRES